MAEREGTDTADKQQQYTPAPQIAPVWLTLGRDSMQGQQGCHPPHRQDGEEGEQDDKPYTHAESAQHRRPGNGKRHGDRQEIAQQAWEVELHSEAPRPTYQSSNGS